MIWRPNKWFLTGGNGFVGGHLIRRLIADGVSVRALARLPKTLRKSPRG
ncbi:NAD-dependent epimerase/dehydratase family protein [Nocardia tengchongensis]